MMTRNLSFVCHLLLYRNTFTFCLNHVIYCEDNFLPFFFKYFFKILIKPSAENNYHFCRHLIQLLSANTRDQLSLI